MEQNNSQVSIQKSKLIYILEVFIDIFEQRTFIFDTNFTTNADKENDLFTGDFDISAVELLKHEERELILKNVDINSDFYYTSRQNVSKLDIIRDQNMFYELLNKIINSLNDQTNDQLLVLKSKMDFKSFFIQHLKQNSENADIDDLLNNRLILKVSIYMFTF